MRLSLTLAIVLWAGSAEAATKCVNGSTGSDANTYAQNNGTTTCWQTIARAAWGSTTRASPNTSEAAQAGDTVVIAAGTYAVLSTWNAPNGLTDIYYNPANSGTAGNPIRFESDTGTRGAITLTNSGGRGALIGASVKNYIEWADFTITDTNALSDLGNTGKVIFYGATGGSIENSILRGSASDESNQQGDNWSGVRFNDSTGIRVYNNIITDFGPNLGDENNSGITTYQTDELTIEHNTFERNGSGIYMKGNQVPNPTVGSYTIRYNIFASSSYAGMYVLLIPSTDAQPNLIYQNIFRDNVLYGIKVRAHDGDIADSRYAQIINNTFYENPHHVWVDGDQPAAAGHLFQNNILAEGEWAYRVTTTTDIADGVWDSEHNVYYSQSNTHADVAGTDWSVTDWKTTYTRDTDTPEAITTDPLFAAVLTDDYRLCTAVNTPVTGCSGASPALTLGRVVRSVGGTNGATIPAGAYITGTETIGVESGNSPSAPIRLRISGADAPQ